MIKDACGRVHLRRSSSVDDLAFVSALPKTCSSFGGLEDDSSSVSSGAKTLSTSVSTDSLHSGAVLFPRYPTPRIDDSDVQLLEEVGAGHSGIVYRAWQRSHRRLVACKTLHGLGCRGNLLGELDLVLRCHGPHLVICHGVMTSCRMHAVSIVMEWMDGGSFERFAGRIPMPILAAIARAMILGLEELSDGFGVCHCDIRPSNVLFSAATGAIKLVDFGESRPSTGGDDILTAGIHIRPRLESGTEAYMSPARLDPIEHSPTTHDDIWSVGVTLFELATGRHPFWADGDSLVELVESILELENRQQLLLSITDDALRGFVSLCWEGKSSIQALLLHPFISQAASDREVARWAAPSE